jgi:hypothetical protein
MRPLALRREFLALLVAATVCFPKLAPAMEAGPGGGKRWIAGGYSFSDELGGFTITGIGGSGTKEDPIVIEEELVSASPVTLVIRAEGIVPPSNFGGESDLGFTYFRFVTLNNSGLAWVEFEFELQEIKDLPSLFGDGLSFDQRRTESENIGSDHFANHSRDFEPYDRLRFLDGKVDPLQTSSFDFLVTDFTPRSQFYIVQDPRIPSS